MTLHVHPFLKWPGGKFRLIDKILPRLPHSPLWVEPFVGAGSVFLNVESEHAILNDINQDLIHLYQTLQREGKTFIDYAEQFFVAKNNQADRYYELRAQFNQSAASWLRSALFLYLNRHGYNGLCRYNRKGEFNVPFGLYKHPTFPREALQVFHQKAQRAVFTCQDYRSVLQTLEQDAVVYCDPPYVPITQSASFTQYSGHTFTWQDQQALAEGARALAQKGIPVLISNHDLKAVRTLYQGARIHSFLVARTISCKTSVRRSVRELLALFAPPVSIY